MNLLKKVLGIFVQMLRVFWTALFGKRYFKKGSKKLNKRIKKNEREQDESLYPYEERWAYSLKRTNNFLKRLGITVEVEGRENMPKGIFWLTPNHSSNFDIFYLVSALAKKHRFTGIAKDSLRNNKSISGYLKTADIFFIDRSNIRQSVAAMDNSAQYAKRYGRGVVIFPEGFRSLNADLQEFRPGAFKFAQKYFLPIVPVTICGTLEARRWWQLKKRKVVVKIHPVLKPTNVINLETTRIAERVKETIQKGLSQWYDSLDPKAKANHDKLKAKMEVKATKLKTQYKEQVFGEKEATAAKEEYKQLTDAQKYLINNKQGAQIPNQSQKDMMMQNPMPLPQNINHQPNTSFNSPIQPEVMTVPTAPISNHVAEETNSNSTIKPIGEPLTKED